MNDPIERQAAIDGFWQLDIEIRPSAINAILNMLNSLPSAQPERCEDCGNFSKTRLLIPQPEITEEQVKEYCEKRHLVVLSSDVFHHLKSAQLYGMCLNTQRTGRWIKNDNGTYSCDQCHSWIPNEQYYYARYCIFCGARMEVKE